MPKRRKAATTKTKKIKAKKTKMKTKTKAKKTKAKATKKAKTAKRKPARAAKTTKKTLKRAAKAVTAKHLGKVVHYYDKLGVAIVDLKSPLRVGDTVKLKRGDQEIYQQVGSMQIDHTAVATAKKGDVVGLKVDSVVPEGTLVMPV